MIIFFLRLSQSLNLDNFSFKISLSTFHLSLRILSRFYQLGLGLPVSNRYEKQQLKHVFFLCERRQRDRQFRAGMVRSPPLGTQPLSISYSVIPRVWPLISGPSMAAGILANIQAAGWRMDKEVAVLS